MIKILKFATAIAFIFLLCGFSSKESKLIQSKVAAKIELPTWYHEGLYFDGKNIWVSNGLKGKTLVVDPANGNIIREIDPAGTFTEAITSKEKDEYIVTDWDASKMYTARIENNLMYARIEIPLEPAHPAGVVWNGKNILLITWTRSLTGTKFALLKMDEKFNIVNSRNIKDIQEPCQIAWDGKHLWISSWYDNRVYKIDVDTLDVLGYFKSPVKKTTGIVWDGKSLWVTGTYADLYKIELQN
jgi:glutamine cyclotransferase